MNIISKSLLYTCMIFLTSCGRSSDDSSSNSPTPELPISDAPVSGTVKGQPWTTVSAIAQAIGPNGGDQLRITLFPFAVSDPCAVNYPEGISERIEAVIPKAAGVYTWSLETGLSSRLHFFFASRDTRATGATDSSSFASGHIRITKLSEVVTGDLKFDAVAMRQPEGKTSTQDSHVVGTFAAKLCPRS